MAENGIHFTYNNYQHPQSRPPTQPPLAEYVHKAFLHCPRPYMVKTISIPLRFMTALEPFQSERSSVVYYKLSGAAYIHVAVGVAANPGEA